MLIRSICSISPNGHCPTHRKTPSGARAQGGLVIPEQERLSRREDQLGPRVLSV